MRKTKQQLIVELATISKQFDNMKIRIAKMQEDFTYRTKILLNEKEDIKTSYVGMRQRAYRAEAALERQNMQIADTSVVSNMLVTNKLVTLKQHLIDMQHEVDAIINLK